MNLRPYQQRAIEQTRQAFAAGARGVCLTLPTGAGKTVVASHVARMHMARGGQVGVLCHRRELIRQTRAKLDAIGLTDAWVDSVQTMVRREPRPASLVIFDECHHFAADLWSALPRAYDQSHRLGLTATPQRGDGKALVGFDALVVGATVRELTELGHLVPCRVFAPAEGTTTLSDPVEAVRSFSRGQRPTVVFCANVEHARQVAAELTGECIEGRLPKGQRDRVLLDFERGPLSVLTNVHVLTEGWDAPRAEICVIARGASSASTYLQMVGRVLRPHPGKSEALVIDCKGSVRQHGLPADDREWSLDGEAHRLSEKLDPIRQCRGCGGVSRPSKICPFCGLEFPPPKVPESKALPLREVDSTTPERVKRGFLEAMLKKAKDRGYAPGWAAHLFRSRWGHWPDRKWMR